MKIFFRYLLMELLQPFLFCIIACSTLWIVADLFGSLDDFYENKAPIGMILTYYAAQFPRLMVDVLPVAMLFASLYALLVLTKRNELTALQAGGLSSLQLFSPFIFMAFVVSAILFYDVSWPATKAEARRAAIMKQLKNQRQDSRFVRGLVYVDQKKNRVWYLRQLNLASGQAEDVELLQRDEQGHDVEKYFARYAEYTGGYWRLRNVHKNYYSLQGDITRQENMETVDLNDYTMSPSDLIFTQSKPSELTLSELGRYLEDSVGQSPTRLAPYRTQYHYLFAYPMSVLVLLGFALALGTKPGRGGPASGVFNAIFILLGYLFVMQFFTAMGRGNRLSAFVSVWLCPLFFGAVALGMMGYRFGWLWHLQRRLKGAHPTRAAASDSMSDTHARDLRLKGLRLMLDKITRQNQPPTR
jgi:lipopolysaccharide export system permease protein